MNDTGTLKKDSVKGFIWRAIQNVSTQLMSFIISIILARILTPGDYGIIGLTSTFIVILNVFVSTGFTSALVQQKEINEEDKSSMYFLSIIIGVALYVVVFFAAPLVALFYRIDLLKDVFRVQGISIVISSLFSVHNAIIVRNLDFKKNFVAGIIAVTCQGVVGITMAMNGFGVWALVIGTLVNNVVNCILLYILCKWLPRPYFSFASVKRLLSFSSKVLAGNLLNTVYNSVKTLVIGRVYDAEMVGFYNKGYQFPTVMMNGIDGAMTTVLFSSLSKVQDNKELLVRYLRRSMKASLAVVVPLLCGMAAVADPMIRLLLTDKWADAIPFVMLTCAICLTWPLSARSQALNAIGKSGTNLIINVITKTIGIGLVFASIPLGVYVMCISSLVSSLISFVIYSVVISRNFEYTIRQQITDVLPVYTIGLMMFGLVYGLSFLLQIHLVLKLFILILVGIVAYIGPSLLFKMEGFLYVLDLIKGLLRKKKA